MLPIRVTPEDLTFLIDKGFIIRKDDEVLLTKIGKEIFELKEDLFVKFFELFPYKVPDGMGNHRILGTKSPDTILGGKMRKKWHSVTKGNIALQEDMVKALEVEVEYRTRTNTLVYMQNMETWLNNGTWEKYMDAAEQNEEKRSDKIL